MFPLHSAQLLLPSHTHQQGMDTAGSGGQHAWGTAKPFPPQAGSIGVCSVGSCSGSTLSPNLTPLPHASWCKGHNTLEVTTPEPGHHLIRPPVPGLILTPQYPRAQRAWCEIAKKKCCGPLRGHRRKEGRCILVV